MISLWKKNIVKSISKHPPSTSPRQTFTHILPLLWQLYGDLLLYVITVIFSRYNCSIFKSLLLLGGEGEVDYFSRVPGLKQPNPDTDGAEMSSTPGDTSRRLRLSDPRRAVKSKGRRSLAFPLQSGSSYSTWLQPDNSIRCLFSCPRAWLQNPKSPSTPSGLASLDCKWGPDKAVDHIKKGGGKEEACGFQLLKGIRKIWDLILSSVFSFGG